LKKTAILLVLLVSMQISLGAFTVLSRKAVAVTTAHVATGALLLGTALAFTLASRRQRRAADARAASSGLARSEAIA
jgi:heme A synthase